MYQKRDVSKVVTLAVTLGHRYWFWYLIRYRIWFCTGWSLPQFRISLQPSWKNRTYLFILSILWFIAALTTQIFKQPNKLKVTFSNTEGFKELTKNHLSLSEIKRILACPCISLSTFVVNFATIDRPVPNRWTSWKVPCFKQTSWISLHLVEEGMYRFEQQYGVSETNNLHLITLIWPDFEKCGKRRLSSNYGCFRLKKDEVISQSYMNSKVIADIYQPLKVDKYTQRLVICNLSTSIIYSGGECPD